ncbi:MAG TPA: sensor domain-containing diguanylate cyclase [Armatimonadota bacterium]|jgi:diguanylate cyclase (GGDEF)-like protein
MQSAPKPANEKARLEALERLSILDTPPEQAYDDLVALAAFICDTPIAMVSLVDADRQWFKSKLGTSSDGTPRDIAFCAHGILEPDLLMVPDTAEDARFADNPLVTEDPGVRFYAGVPLVLRDGAAVGMLCAVDRRPRQMSEAQIQALRALGRQVVSQFDLRERNVRLVQEIAERHCVEQALRERDDRLRDANARLESLSITDGLTGLKNHRCFQETLAVEFQRARRYGSPLTLILADVDRFKEYNDAFGHPAGDKVLRQVSDMLRAGLRSVDLAARYRGEEFALILPGTPLAGAAEVAERLRAAIEAGPWRLRPVTASFGLAEANDANPTPVALIRSADAALYQAKHDGRNRFILSPQNAS